MQQLSSMYREHRLLRFLLVGICNTGFSYSVYALFIFLGLSYPIANLIALVFGIVFSFHTQGKFVFGNTERARFPRFVFIWVLIYFANIAIIGLLIRLGANAYSGGALALVPVTILSYVLQKLIVFRSAT